MNKTITKAQDCSSTKCINRYVKKGLKGLMCSNCITELKKFVKELERERED